VSTVLADEIPLWENKPSPKNRWHGAGGVFRDEYNPMVCGTTSFDISTATMVCFTHPTLPSRFEKKVIKNEDRYE